MDVKLFSLCNEESEAVESGKNCIEDCVKCFFPESSGFVHFTSQKRMILAMAQSLRGADIVIVAVQGAMYNTTKKLLSEALDLDMEKNEYVAGNLLAGSVKPSVYESCVTFPVGAEILPTKSMVNCGFALTAGGQHIVYMPIDDPNAQEVVFGSLYDYLASTNLCEDKDVIAGMNYRHQAIFNRTAHKLSDENVKVAVAKANGVEIISNNIAKKHKSCFVIEDGSKHGLADRRETIDTARSVRNTCNAQLGAAVSDVISDDEGNRFAFIAIADSEGTKAIKIFASADESEEDFVSACIDHHMLNLYNYNELGGESDETQEALQKNTQLRGYLGVAASGLALLASVAGLLIAIFMK